jgi:hypothetical protein
MSLHFVFATALFPTSRDSLRQGEVGPANPRLSATDRDSELVIGAIAPRCNQSPNLSGLWADIRLDGLAGRLGSEGPRLKGRRGGGCPERTEAPKSLVATRCDEADARISMGLLLTRRFDL